MPVLPPGLDILKRLGSTRLHGIQPAPEEMRQAAEGGESLTSKLGFNTTNPSEAGRTLNYLRGIQNPPRGSEMGIMPGGPGGGSRWLQNPMAQTAEGASVLPRVTPELVAKAQAGDAIARDQVIDGLQGLIKKTAGRYVKPGSRLEMDDLMAEGNLIATKVLDTKSPNDFFSYVSQAIDRHLKNYSIKQSPAIKGAVSGAEAETTLGTMEDVASRIQDLPPSVRNKMLNDAMAKLTTKEQEAVSMHLGLGEQDPMSLRDIATSLGKHFTSVDARLKSGMAKLKNELQAKGMEPSDLSPEMQKAPPAEAPRSPSSEASAMETPGPVETTRPAAPISGGSDAPELGGLSQSDEIRNLLSRRGEAEKSYQMGRMKSDFGIKRLEGEIQGQKYPGMRSVVEEAGAQWRGIVDQQHGFPEPHVMFDDPATGTTLFHPVADLSRNNLMSKMAESRAQFGDQGAFGAAKPIGGGSAADLTPLGKSLADRLRALGEAGGQAGPRVNPEELSNYPASWPSQEAATADAASEMSRPGGPGYAADLQKDPEALRRYLKLLDQYIYPEGSTGI